MKKFAVYGADTIVALKEFDTITEAMQFAKKNLRKHGKTIRSTVYHKNLYKVFKNKFGEIKVIDLR